MSSIFYKEKTKKYRIAGCISLEDDASSFGYEWHHCLTPIEKDYTAIENAIFYCASIGCDSIWVTVEDSWSPLIKKRVKDYIHDPVWFFRKFDRLPRDRQKLIPIFFVPHLSIYRKRRKSVNWGIINSALYSKKIMSQVSGYCAPQAYFACSPYNVFRTDALEATRKSFKGSTNKFHLSCDNKSYVTNDFLPFMFDNQDLDNIVKRARKKEAGKYFFDENGQKQTRPIEDRCSIADMSLSNLFSPIDNSTPVEIENYWNINSWKGYKSFLKDGCIIKRKSLFKGKRELEEIKYFYDD